MLVNDPDFEGGEGDFGGKAMTYYGRWTYKYEEGARQGAKGVLVIHETEPASYGWATVKNSNTNAMFDIVRKNPARRASAARRLDPARPGGAIVRGLGHQLRGDEGGRQAQGLQAGAAQGHARRPRRCEDRGHHLEQCRRHPARHGAARRDRDLHGPLGPSRHRPARCDRRPHLQWRDRQRHRHRPADRAGARLRRRPAARSARSCSWP